MDENIYLNMLHIKYKLLEMINYQAINVRFAHRTELAEESDLYFRLDYLYKVGPLPLHGNLNNEEEAEKAFYNSNLKNKIEWKITNN